MKPGDKVVALVGRDHYVRAGMTYTIQVVGGVFPRGTVGMVLVEEVPAVWMPENAFKETQ